VVKHESKRDDLERRFHAEDRQEVHLSLLLRATTTTSASADGPRDALLLDFPLFFDLL